MNMRGRELLLAAIDEAYNRQSWHGPNLRGSLRGVRNSLAVLRPAPGRHNIAEVAVHAAYWKYVVRRRLSGMKRGSFTLPGSNWFPRGPELPASAWKRDLDLLDREHLLLRDCIAGLSLSELAGERSLRLVRGIAAHDLYHAGQIQLLKRLLTSSIGT